MREHEAGRVHLKAPALLTYEVTNAVWKAERAEVFPVRKLMRFFKAAAGLDIELFPLEWGESLPLARRFGRSTYDVAYLALAERLGESLITGDLRL